MKRFIILIFTVLIYSVPSVAQVRKFQIGARDNSIIRSVDDEHVLIYTQPVVDSGYFILYKRSDNTALAISLPIKWEIRDVRIHNGDEAYFCGTDGSRGLIGMFDIPQFFFGNVGINYTTFGWSWLGYVWPTDLKRLDLYEDGTQVHMAMTGSSIWHIRHQLPATTVMSAYFDGSNWNWVGYPNKDLYMQFTDVACLDDIIVAVGTDRDGTGCYMKTFEKLPEFPKYPLDINHMTELNYDDPQGTVLVTHRLDNTAILSQFNRGTSGIGTVFHQVPFSPSSGLPTMTLIDTWRSSPPATLPFGSMWQMLELNWDVDNAWLLQKAEYAVSPVSGIADWLLKVPVGAPSVIGQRWNPHQCNAQSMDLLPITHNPWLSGSNPLLTIYEPMWQGMEGHCYRFANLGFDYGSAPWITRDIDDDWDYNLESNIPKDMPVFDVKVILECE